MSFRLATRRTALRSALAAAALTGAVLVPAATAFADTTPAGPAPSTPAPTTSAPSSPAPTKPADEGTLIRTDKLTGGLTAKVYKHGDELVWYTASVLKGDRVLGTLTAGAGHQAKDTKVFGEISVSLHADGRVTSANDHGSGGQGPETPVKCVAEITKGIGGGTAADLGISPSGPYVRFKDAGDGTPLDYSLDRLHPKLPASAGFVGEIINPNSSSPRLRYNMQGGGNPDGYADFPKLPKGCSFRYDTGSGSGTGTQSSQTSVVPKGSVAAGAEPAQGADPVLVAVGGAAAAAGAAGIGFVVLRRRTAAAGR
ncbi:hypothetical protein [Streptomyces sp. NBC_01285]|uniref:hypothetical protein n=1 Tax=Streptomyces sp. NBC_01285 TaxID=2903813 RepID=UPI002258A437|nr:hypothetical protein [Streptomyces sp. NBC_01285]MCX4775004.1 hypothetical protein [Streptomyces sp. NBC_01285]